MKQNTRLLPIASVGFGEFLVDLENREFRDFDNPDNVIKMHSPAGRELLGQMQGGVWNSMGISNSRRKELEV